MKCMIDGNTYEYRDDIRDDVAIRAEFNKLCGRVFKLDFEQWYQNGYWDERFIPHVLLSGTTVAANITVNLLDMGYMGETRRYIQLGTVMTAPEFRGKELSRWLMEHVLSQWKDQCDALFLLANDTVTGYYPKYGFVPTQQYEAMADIRKTTSSVRKLDLSVPDDRKLLLKYYTYSNPYSALTAENHAGLLMFYCGGHLKDSVYYLEQLDAVAIAEYHKDSYTCYDIFTDSGHGLHEILSALAAKGTDTARLGFSPKEPDGFQVTARRAKDETLFVFAEKENIFAHNRLMVPLLAHT